jgi:di/tricarboxylate transporter
MEWQGWTTVGVVALTITLLCATRVGPDLLMLGALTLLLTLGVLKSEDALAGFANEGMVTVAVMFVVAAGLNETGALETLFPRLLGRPQSVTQAQARLMVTTVLVGAFVYKSLLVPVLLPVVADWAKKNRLSLSRVMIPLSYAAILGGTCTLIGSSSNLLVNGLLLQAGLPGQDFFEVAWLGLPCTLAGLAYVLLVGRWLLPERRPAFSDQDDPRRYTVEMLVEQGSSLVGRSIEQAGLRHLAGVYLVEIDRDGEVLPAVSPQEKLRANDRLVFAGVVESVVDLQKVRGLKPASDQVFKLTAPRAQRCLIEAVVSNSCPLVGQTIREGRFRTVYQAAVIALARNGTQVRKKIGDIVLQAGDTLLLEAPPGFVDRHRNSRDFFLVSLVENSTPRRHDRAAAAVAILAAMVVVVVAGWLSMFQAALVAAGLMILARCCSAAEARRSIDLKLVLVIAAALGIGRAVQTSGAATAIAHTLIDLAGTSPWAALAAVYALTVLFTELMSHYAAVVLIFPVALETANALGVDFRPFAMAIMIAGSCAFALPMGSLPNLMVYGAGGYHFRDYLRLGGPLNLLTGVITVLLAPLVWPF